MGNLTRRMMRHRKQLNIRPASKDVRRGVELMNNWQRHQWAKRGYRQNEAEAFYRSWLERRAGVA